jgi:predicted ATPase
MSVVSTQFASRVTLLRDKVESFERYPFSLPAIRTLDFIDLHPKITFLVGENGSGKSTLLEGLAVSLGFNAEGGSGNFNFGTRASHSELHEYLRIAKGYRRRRDGFFLRAESWFNLGTEIERLDAEPFGGPPIINSYGGRSLHEQSHGESFMALLKKRLGGDGLYLLDEPEAALSPTRQIEALQRLHELVLKGSQFVIATHSPILMAYPDALILHCGANGIHPIAYEDTEHFRVTRDFLLHRDKVLAILMDR